MTDEPRGMTRRRFLQVLGGVGLAGGVSFLVARGIAFRPAAPAAGRAGSAPATPGPSAAAAPAADSLDELARSVRHGAPGKDAIPAIDRPRLVAASNASFLADEDVVFGLVRDGQARAYPQLVLFWHEIVNDRFPSGPLSVTYCPLTGSAVAFRGTAPDGRPSTFGTSGDLVNSNLLLYDRQTDSRWPQLLGQAISGPSRGRVLEPVPLDWTSWGRWRAVHPDTLVLSTRTGYLRQYGNDPYGSYNYGASHELFRCYTRAAASTRRRSWWPPSSAQTAWRSASPCCASGGRSRPGWAADRRPSATTRRWMRAVRTLRGMGGRRSGWSPST